MNDVTLILTAIEQGDAKAAEKLLPLVYKELRRLAVHKMSKEPTGQTLQATALVHEAYIVSNLLNLLSVSALHSMFDTCTNASMENKK
jgi:hypothetical protein